MRSSCGLCDQLSLALELLKLRLPFEYDKVDIEHEPEYLAKYSNDIPVLLDGKVEICRGLCDPAVIESYLRARS